MQRLLEPAAWVAALLGGCLSALVLPPLLFSLGVMVPLGGLGPAEDSFAGLRSLLSASWLLRAALAAVHALIFWFAAHQFRILMRDLGWRLAPFLAALGYGLALVGGLSAVRILANF